MNCSVNLKAAGFLSAENFTFRVLHFFYILFLLCNARFLDNLLLVSFLALCSELLAAGLYFSGKSFAFPVNYISSYQLFRVIMVSAITLNEPHDSFFCRKFSNSQFSIIIWECLVQPYALCYCSGFFKIVKNHVVNFCLGSSSLQFWNVANRCSRICYVSNVRIDVHLIIKISMFLAASSYVHCFSTSVWGNIVF